MWHVLRAEAGARIALGFRRTCTREEVKAACLDGTVEELLHYEEPAAGATYFTRANTVHALGAGLTVVEIQQHSDTTYRLYDYGRPRELHLEAGLAVSDLGPWRPEPAPPAEDDLWTPLAACEYFQTWSAALTGPVECPAADRRFSLFITLRGSGTLAGHAIGPGEVWLVSEPQAVEIVPNKSLHLLRVLPA
jgi:mannose-6-phosphate isomerase